MELHQLDAQSLGNLENSLVPIELFEDDSLDADVADCLEAVPAVVRTQCPSTIMWPTSSQWGRPRTEPL